MIIGKQPTMNQIRWAPDISTTTMAALHRAIESTKNNAVTNAQTFIY